MTTHTVEKVTGQASYIKKLAADDPMRVGDAIDENEKGCHLAIHGVTITRQQTTESLAANKTVSRKKRRMKVII